MDQIDDFLSRGVENIIPGKETLEKALRSGKKLNVYFGIDPTATKIHIGNAVGLRKLQALVELGHNVTFLIGDFTALIGDTSDKDSERPVLTSEQITENFKSYKEQASKFLDFSKVKVVHNSDWLRKLTFRDIIELCQHFSVGDFVSRELIRKRMDAGTKVRLDELLYPVMQGYDSYYMDTDLQLGGTDQTFNMQAGRTLQKDLRGKDSFVLSLTFLEGTDGRKMSKSWGNAIWVTTDPEEMYGRVMSIKDDLIIRYFTLATNLPMSDIQAIEAELISGKNPMLAKKTLAHQIVTELHSSDAASKAQKYFEDAFQSGDASLKTLPTEELKLGEETDLKTVILTHNILPSTSEFKRLVSQGGIELNGKKIESREDTQLKKGDILIVGKRKFFKVV